MGERIKALRKALGLTQQEFADRLGIKRATIAHYEVGRNEPIDAIITLICREYDVDEVWLRTGVGEMFRPRTREDDIFRLASALVDLSDQELKVLRLVIRRLADKL